MCDASRDDTELLHAGRQCVVCGALLPSSGRGRYCSRACQQRAYRLRRTPDQASLLQAWSRHLSGRRLLVGQTVYECPRCEQRLLGQRRCPDCNLMARKLGLGGDCPHCDELLLVTELLGGLLP